MTVFVHSIVIISFKFLFVDRLGPTATLRTVFEYVFLASYSVRFIPFFVLCYPGECDKYLTVYAFLLKLVLFSYRGLFNSIPALLYRPYTWS